MLVIERLFYQSFVEVNPSPLPHPTAEPPITEKRAWTTLNPMPRPYIPQLKPFSLKASPATPGETQLVLFCQERCAGSPGGSHMEAIVWNVATHTSANSSDALPKQSAPRLLLKRKSHKHTNLVTGICPLIPVPNTFERRTPRFSNLKDHVIQFTRLLDSSVTHGSSRAKRPIT